LVADGGHAALFVAYLIILEGFVTLVNSSIDELPVDPAAAGTRRTSHEALARADATKDWLGAALVPRTASVAGVAGIPSAAAVRARSASRIPHRHRPRRLIGRPSAGLHSSSVGALQVHSKSHQISSDKNEQKDRPEHLGQEIPGITPKMNKQHPRDDPEEKSPQPVFDDSPKCVHANSFRTTAVASATNDKHRAANGGKRRFIDGSDSNVQSILVERSRD
jgi:hypothetical protein